MNVELFIVSQEWTVKKWLKGYRLVFLTVNFSIFKDYLFYILISVSVWKIMI